MSDAGEGGDGPLDGAAPAPRRHRAGLCATCRHHREVGNRRGSVFFMCARAKTDPRYRKYPPLPVLACAGWQAGDENPRERHTEESE